MSSLPTKFTGWCKNVPLYRYVGWSNSSSGARVLISSSISDTHDIVSTRVTFTSGLVARSTSRVSRSEIANLMASTAMGPPRNSVPPPVSNSTETVKGVTWSASTLILISELLMSLR